MVSGKYLAGSVSGVPGKRRPRRSAEYLAVGGTEALGRRTAGRDAQTSADVVTKHPAVRADPIRRVISSPFPLQIAKRLTVLPRVGKLSGYTALASFTVLDCFRLVPPATTTRCRG